MCPFGLHLTRLRVFLFFFDFQFAAASQAMSNPSLVENAARRDADGDSENHR
jgi:hypothetical protein